MLTRSQLEEWATSSWTVRPGLWLPAFSQNTQPHLNEERFEGWVSALHYSNLGFRNRLSLEMPFKYKWLWLKKGIPSELQISINIIISWVNSDFSGDQYSWAIPYTHIFKGWTILGYPLTFSSRVFCRFHHIFLIYTAGGVIWWLWENNPNSQFD